MFGKSLKFIFCSLFLLAFVALSAWGIHICFQVQETQEWEKIEAELLSISLSEKERWSSDDDGNSTKTIDRKVTPRYMYFYNGTEYFGKKVSVSNGYRSLWVYEKLENAQTISVYVNPKKSSESVIINQIDRDDIVLILIGYFFAAIILAAMVSEFGLSSKIYYLILLVGIMLGCLCHFEFEWGKMAVQDYIEIIN